MWKTTRKSFSDSPPQKIAMKSTTTHLHRIKSADEWLESYA